MCVSAGLQVGCVSRRLLPAIRGGRLGSGFGAALTVMMAGRVRVQGAQRRRAVQGGAGDEMMEVGHVSVHACRGGFVGEWV